jgi:hypothetical protein
MRTRIKLLACLLVVALGLVAAPAARAADVYEDYTKIGSVTRSYGDRFNVRNRWNAYEGYRSIGYVKRSYGGRWDIYSGYSKVGYVKRSYGSRWNVYESYSKVGEVRGPITGGPAGGAALLLLLG